MLQFLDVTGSRFQHLELREGTVAFNPATIFRPTVELLAWGVVVRQWAAIELFGTTTDVLPPLIRSCFPCPLYIAAWSKLTVNVVKRITMQHAPIAPSIEQRHTFLKSDSGKQISLKKDCGVDGMEPDAGDAWYDIAAYLEQPYGDLYLQLLASGEVTLQFDLDTCVPFDLYVSQPGVYDYDRFRERQAKMFHQ